MFTQFFGNFLLKKGVIDAEQLLAILQNQNNVKIKLGTLAMCEGYMTASEVEKIHILQTHVDKKFGELAIEEGYLTPEQVDELCTAQRPDYLTFGQALVDGGYVTSHQLEDLMIDYQSEHEIEEDDLNDSQKDSVSVLVNDVYTFDEFDSSAGCVNYITLLFNNLIRFIGKDFTPLDAQVLPEYATKNCTYQNIRGDLKMFSAIDMDVATSIEFASRYMGKSMDEYDEYIEASVEDFLNLHNGLFSVNMSNDVGIELDLDPLGHIEDSIISLDSIVFYIPVIFPFGTVNFLLSPNVFKD